MADAQQLIATATRLLDDRQGMPHPSEPRLREADVRARIAQATAANAQADALDRIAQALTRLADHETSAQPITRYSA